MNESGEPMIWWALVGLFVNPTKVLVIEAMLWIERPMSAVELDRTFDNDVNLSTISYHVTSLARLGILERTGKRQVRGALESFYYFANADE